MGRLEWSEVPEMLPWLLPHDGLVLIGGGSVVRRQEEAVVSPGNNLWLTLDDLHKLQLGPRLLIILGHREIRDLNDVGVFEVIDWGPTAETGGGGEGGKRKEEKGQDNKEVKSHGWSRLFDG